MKKTIIPIILGILLISLTSALSLYSGESHTWDFGKDEFINYNISGNTHDLEGLNFTNTTNSLTLEISINYKPDNWTIKIITSREIIEEEVRSRGGSGGTFIPRVVSKEDVSKGVTRLLSVGTSYNFEINGNSHEFRILNVTENSATIRIRSEEIIITLNLGETKIVCIDNKEVKVTLDNVKVYKTISYAETTLQSTDIKCGIPEELIIEYPIEEPIDDKDTKEIIPTIFLAILLLLILVFIIILIDRKKEKENEQLY